MSADTDDRSTTRVLAGLAVITLLIGGVFVGVRAFSTSRDERIAGPVGTDAPTTTVAPATSLPDAAAVVGSGSAGVPDTSEPSQDAVAAVPERFETIPPGGVLPSDAECAERVRRGEPEVRPENASYNATVGSARPDEAKPTFPRYARVTGNFTGTTDEIIQWTACKWGIDEDVVRAQAAKETYWFQKNAGDFTTDASRCVPGHPVGADGRPGECPESIGIMQVRFPYFDVPVPEAITSTAYNLDLAYAIWRSCFEGEEAWLNQVERGREYEAGDLWGCVGRWYAGRWYIDRGIEYMTAVQDYVDQRIWQTRGFLNYRD